MAKRGKTVDLSAETKPKGDSYYNKRAQNYVSRRSKQAWWHVEQDAVKAFLERLDMRLFVLDVPFGTGRFLPYYHERECNVCGLDASAEMFEAARVEFGDEIDDCELTVASATQMPYEDSTFDLVTSTRFLRDIITFGDAKLTMEEISRVCKGHAILELGMSHTEEDGHLEDGKVMGSKMSKSQITEFLAGYGFDILDKTLVHGAAEDAAAIYIFLCKKQAI